MNQAGNFLGVFCSVLVGIQILLLGFFSMTGWWHEQPLAHVADLWDTIEGEDEQAIPYEQAEELLATLPEEPQHSRKLTPASQKFLAAIEGNRFEEMRASYLSMNGQEQQELWQLLGEEEFHSARERLMQHLFSRDEVRVVQEPAATITK
ncbi:Hypothetical protein PBC10988_30130 [Planctomycetales bacterium 10988]|nr:Hypothetical protein PBC10988_30130 [Planctomycetales bacterium 10988]